jgi:periplasmic mercuric ion binding protein
MKRLSSAAVLATVLLASGSVHAGEQTVTLSVENMTCASCPFIVKRTLTAVPGVSKAEVSLQDKTATVTYDDNETGVEALTAATTNAGYPSQPRN